MTEFSKRIGDRIKLCVNRNGYLNHDYGYGCDLKIRAGWNDSCEIITNNLSVDDLRDLRYLIDCALLKAVKS
jgi:hypothetical protein